MFPCGNFARTTKHAQQRKGHKMKFVKGVRFGSSLLLAIATSSSALAEPRAANPVLRTGIPAQQRATVEHFATAAQALERVLATPARVVAFGEYHQTRETTKIRSSLARFTTELLPQVAKLASDLVVETWVADGRCGKHEEKVVKEVQTTTERPPETESEIVTLIKGFRQLRSAREVPSWRHRDRLRTPA
jgi:hypothetical protein